MATCGKPLVASHIVADERLEPWAAFIAVVFATSSFETSLATATGGVAVPLRMRNFFLGRWQRDMFKLSQP